MISTACAFQGRAYFFKRSAPQDNSNRPYLEPSPLAHKMARSSSFKKDTMPTPNNPFGSEAKLSTKAGEVTFYDLGKLEELGLAKLD